MSWSTITVDDLLVGLTGAERNAVRTAALADGQDDPLVEAIAQGVQDVRGYIAACRQNTLGEGATVPAELKADACAIIRYRALNRLNLRSLLSATREMEYKDAIRKLERVSDCKFAIEQPAAVSDQVIGGPGVEVVDTSTRRATRAKLDGL